MHENRLPSYSEVRDDVEKIYDLHDRNEAIRQLARYVIESVEEALLLAHPPVPAQRLSSDSSLIQDISRLEEEIDS